MAESLTMALAKRIGRDAAYGLVRDLITRATAEGLHLRDAALADERVRATLSSDAISRAFDPAAYLGSTGIFIDRALSAFNALQSERATQGTTDAAAEEAKQHA